MQLEVPRLGEINANSSITEISAILDKQTKHTLLHVPWRQASEKLPHVNFAIGHCDQWLFVKYFVHEPFYRVTKHRTNEAVYKDSCVELFICFEEDSSYYNLEFNSIGVCLGGYGPDRHNRRSLPAATLEKIQHQSAMRHSSQNKRATDWELTIAVPVSVFANSSLHSLKGIKGKANFFKCGDELPEPHFVCWAPIEAPQPDFHLKQFFGKIAFL